MAKYVTNPHEKYYFATQIFIMSRRNRRNRRNFYDHGLFGFNGLFIGNSSPTGKLRELREWLMRRDASVLRLWRWEGIMTLTLKASFQDDSLATLPALRPVA